MPWPCPTNGVCRLHRGLIALWDKTVHNSPSYNPTEGNRHSNRSVNSGVVEVVRTSPTRIWPLALPQSTQQSGRLRSAESLRDSQASRRADSNLRLASYE